MNKNDIHINKLTQSASDALSEFAEDAKNRIFEKAVEIATKKGTADKEISLLDIIEARKQIFKYFGDERKRVAKAKKLSLLLLAIGVMYAFAGIIIFFIQNGTFSLEKDSGLIVSFLGILTIIVGYTYSQYLQNRSTALTLLSDEKDLSTTDFEIVERWQLIEKLVSDIMIEQGYTTDKSRSVSGIIEFLESRLSQLSGLNTFNNLLIARNKIIHESYKPSKEEKSELIRNSNLIIEELEKIRLGNS